VKSLFLAALPVVNDCLEVTVVADDKKLFVAAARDKAAETGSELKVEVVISSLSNGNSGDGTRLPLLQGSKDRQKTHQDVSC
jgi:hypothetical protein